MSKKLSYLRGILYHRLTGKTALTLLMIVEQAWGLVSRALQKVTLNKIKPYTHTVSSEVVLQKVFSMCIEAKTKAVFLWWSLQQNKRRAARLWKQKHSAKALKCSKTKFNIQPSDTKLFPALIRRRLAWRWPSTFPSRCFPWPRV